MIASIEFLGLIIVLGIGVTVYRRLIHSGWFARLIASVTNPSPESDEDVLHHFDSAERTALRRAEDAKVAASEAKKTADTIRRRVRQRPTF